MTSAHDGASASGGPALHVACAGSATSKLTVLEHAGVRIAILRHRGLGTVGKRRESRASQHPPLTSRIAAPIYKTQSSHAAQARSHGGLGRQTFYRGHAGGLKSCENRFGIGFDRLRSAVRRFAHDFAASDFGPHLAGASMIGLSRAHSHATTDMKSLIAFSLGL